MQPSNRFLKAPRKRTGTESDASAVTPAASQSAKLADILRGMARDSLQVRVIAISILVCFLLIYLVARNVVETNRLLTSTVEAELNTHLYAAGLSIGESMNLADYTAKQVRSQWLSDRTLKSQDNLAAEFPNFKSLISQVAIIDQHGVLVGSSLDANAIGVDLSYRPHFVIHKTRTQDQPYIGYPLIGRVSGLRTMQFSRPIFNKEKTFKGVVVVSLNTDFVEHTLLGQRGMVVNKIELVATSRMFDPSATDTAASTLLRVNGSAAPTEGKSDLEEMESADEPHLSLELVLTPYPLILRTSSPERKISELMNTSYFIGMLSALSILLIMSYSTWRFLVLLNHRNRILIKLRESKTQALSANAMKSKFVASISHELRTPLNGILGFSELIGMSDSIEEAQHYGKVVNKSANHLHGLVNTLLDLAKIEAGQMETTLTDSNVKDICDSVVSIHRYEAEKKGLMISLRYAEEMPETIKIDRIKLMQVLNNLLSNAVKFTDNGAVFLTVVFEAEQWVFSVADTGIGMTPSQLEQLFERFNNVKLEQEDSSDRSGAGLGMALCKDLVELMGGTISVFSEIKGGTVVRFQIPNKYAEN